MIDCLFMYGTLMPGQSNHHHVKDIPGHWQRASVRGRLYPKGIGLAAGYPVLVPDESAEPVSGWLLVSDVLDDHWLRLDDFEGVAYTRALLEVMTETGDIIEAFVYVLAEGAWHGE